MSDTHTHAPCLCPACGHMVGAADMRGGKPPAPGDVSLCLRCGEILQYETALRLARVVPSAWCNLLRDRPREARALLEGNRFLRVQRAHNGARAWLRGDLQPWLRGGPREGLRADLQPWLRGGPRDRANRYAISLGLRADLQPWLRGDLQP